MKYVSIGFLSVLVLYGCTNSPRGSTYVGTPWVYGGDGGHESDHGGFGFGGGRNGDGGAGRGGGIGGGGRGGGGGIGGGSGRR